MRTLLRYGLMPPERAPDWLRAIVVEDKVWVPPGPMQPLV